MKFACQNKLTKENTNYAFCKSFSKHMNYKKVKENLKDSHSKDFHCITYQIIFKM